jgi:hypothetical protein
VQRQDAERPQAGTAHSRNGTFTHSQGTFLLRCVWSRPSGPIRPPRSCSPRPARTQQCSEQRQQQLAWRCVERAADPHNSWPMPHGAYWW